MLFLPLSIGCLRLAFWYVYKMSGKITYVNIKWIEINLKKSITINNKYQICV